MKRVQKSKRKRDDSNVAGNTITDNGNSKRIKEL